MAMLRLTLPEPPSANHYWRTVKGRMLVSAQAKAYRSMVRGLYLRQVGKLAVAFPTGDVSVVLTWHRRVRRGDVDNRIKQVLDALRQYAYADDAQVARLYIERVDDGRGTMDVTIMGVAA